MKKPSESDRSAGVPPAVSGASRPRFGEVTIRNRGRLPQHWEWMWVCGRDARTTAAEDGGATKTA
jgi:hypothetical protein